ncbi:FeoB-associated Cys-rich membrane protein [Enterococcus phoeniculicola]|nr:FeoB-associated Cys-rich membrane protein [Enterococcus phoeniculicola]
MATIILSILIFGSASYVIYSRIKTGKTCDDCKTSCPVKTQQSK